MECPRCVAIAGPAGPYRGDGAHTKRAALAPTPHPSGVEIDACDGCGGAFLEHGELEAIENAARRRGKPDGSGADLVRRAYANGRQRDERPPVVCPACGEEMFEREWSFGTMVRIDVCIECGGAWADAGEIEDIERFFGMPARDVPPP